MKTCRRIFAALLMSAFFLSAVGMRADQPKVFRVSDGSVISREDMIGEVRTTEVLFCGEIHNSSLHHQLQLEMIRALTDAGVEVAVGFEMFPREQQATLDRWTDGTMSPGEFRAFYEKYWTLPWSLYQDIFSYIREKGIPALALNVPSDVTETVRRSGFLSLSDEQLKRLPPGLGCNVDRQYMEFMRRIYALHAMKDKELQYFCEMQLLWDKSMAWYLLDYLGKKPQRLVVVVAGLRHAWKKGIPAQLRQYSSQNRHAVLLPEIPGMVEPGELTAEDADYISLRGTTGLNPPDKENHS